MESYSFGLCMSRSTEAFTSSHDTKMNETKGWVGGNVFLCPLYIGQWTNSKKLSKLHSLTNSLLRANLGEPI